MPGNHAGEIRVNPKEFITSIYSNSEAVLSEEDGVKLRAILASFALGFRESVEKMHRKQLSMDAKTTQQMVGLLRLLHWTVSSYLSAFTSQDWHLIQEGSIQEMWTSTHNLKQPTNFDLYPWVIGHCLPVIGMQFQRYAN